MFDLTPLKKRRDLLDAFFDRNLPKEWMGQNNWPGWDAAIRADIKESEDNYLVEAEMPGFKKEDIMVQFNDKVLTIAARREEETKEEKDNYIRQERRRGTIRRSFYVDAIDAEGIKAEYQDGLLKVTLPKLKESSAGTKQIEIE